MSTGIVHLVKCDCGKQIEVEPSAAGTKIRCVCGNLVIVPRLSALRSSVGDHRPSFSAAQAISYMQLAGELPTTSRCALSAVLTEGVMIFCIEREVECLRPSNSLWQTALGPVLGLLPFLREVVTAATHAATYQTVSQSIACVRLRVAPECWARVMQLDEPSWRALLRTEPLYARLLDEIPDAKARLVEVEI